MDSLTRNNGGFFGDLPNQAKALAKRYLEGKVTEEEFLMAKNDDKSPSKN